MKVRSCEPGFGQTATFFCLQEGSLTSRTIAGRTGVTCSCLLLRDMTPLKVYSLLAKDPPYGAQIYMGHQHHSALNPQKLVRSRNPYLQVEFPPKIHWLGSISASQKKYQLHLIYPISLGKSPLAPEILGSLKNSRSPSTPSLVDSPTMG